MITEAFRRNHCYERYNDRWHLWVGDLAWWNENEDGYREGAKFTFEIGFGNHIGDFDFEHFRQPEQILTERRWYLTRWITLQVGRRGFTLNWRGPEITGTDWGIPRWHFDKHGQLLEDYR